MIHDPNDKIPDRDIYAAVSWDNLDDFWSDDDDDESPDDDYDDADWDDYKDEDWDEDDLDS
jgi:hypothetical protein